MGEANAQDPQGWGLWGVGLRLTEQRGPGVPPHPGLRGQGCHLGAQQASWARVGGANTLCSFPLLLEGPSRQPLLISGPQGRRSCLASTSPPPSVPRRPTSTLGGSSHLLGRQGPAPVAGSHPSCGETLTQCLPTLPS